MATTGSEVSAHASSLFGGVGNDYVAATGDGNVLDGGVGDDHLVAAAGHADDIFVFQVAYGMDDVTGFARHGAGGTDVITIQGFGIAT